MCGTSPSLFAVPHAKDQCTKGLNAITTQGNVVPPPPAYGGGHSLKMGGNGKGNA